ncbi:3-hydroxybutyrate dehydrogenase [Enemella evansiae]|uniref:3-hydroxybutyrate dehydrogenase n=1 Tax=Enemella evansiae TaxID=2016499 RepID=A0A255GC63_9ACTN|nr:3-hydroxybutyrate dehydrogenase [Enemella evansiae]PFG68331.1 3-hydroxybutyrate dehydrogenase [Propionibacteriaceae bacterium ES.041]OYN95623.1 3-hydroxybutyrate dehydrogenase [Enemella evansiae]OYN97734.1 3-hydroxybutyrate dehydrogenase [Enemella evansiae]OYO03726.1 3-hydroxybutyrate dehydrogenase [Enemella evansiae]OYO10158.1 3-hydroxybutyrate dehydrogenase [Enemella evansiae]
MSEQNATQPLAGRRAIVTGGASGIGAATSRALAEHGAQVVVADLNEAAAEQLAGEISGEPWVVDLGDTGQLEELRLEADILVNNAGLQQVTPIQDFDPERWRLLNRVMLEAPFLLIRACLPHMYAQSFGRIINVSSVHGLVASAYKSAYVAAKHGLEGLSKVTALEGAEHGVTSVCVNPGYAWTGIVANQVPDQAKAHGMSEDEVVEKVMLAPHAVKRFVDPGDLGQLIAFLAGPHGSMITGSDVVVDGGWTAR